MALFKGSDNNIISQNAKDLRQAGHPEDKSMSFALAEAKKSEKPKHPNRHKNLGPFLHKKKEVK